MGSYHFYLKSCRLDGLLHGSHSCCVVSSLDLNGSQHLVRKVIPRLFLQGLVDEVYGRIVVSPQLQKKHPKANIVLGKD